MVSHFAPSRSWLILKGMWRYFIYISRVSGDIYESGSSNFMLTYDNPTWIKRSAKKGDGYFKIEQSAKDMQAFHHWRHGHLREDQPISCIVPEASCPMSSLTFTHLSSAARSNDPAGLPGAAEYDIFA